MIFRDWFNLSKTLSAGDWPYLFEENIREFSFWPRQPFLWIESYYQITAKIFVEYLGFSWELTERVFWFWPFLVISVFSSYYLTRSWLGVLIYTTNTYILMVVGGGQMGVAMAYALGPLVFQLFINELTSWVLKGMVLAIQIMFDPRMALITMMAVFFYVRKIKFLLLPCLLSVVLNSFWLLPLLKSSLSEFGELAGVEFFSFASFSNTISLLHPNWPENIFGKIYFMRPEFLIIPIVAFSSLLFINELKSSRVKELLYFSFLGLVGGFLAKGTNPPFGAIYLWFFDHLPGFFVFRDSSKFYLLIALAYSVLIPKILSKKRLLIFLFLVFWLLSIRQAVFGQLGGTFQAREVPKEYRRLKDVLVQQPDYFSVFWLPKRQRFGFVSHNHPGLEGPELPSEEELRSQQVKYVIVPYDSEGEIFLEDRKYSSEKRKKIEEELNKVDFLEKMKIDNLDRLAIYQIK